MCLLSILVFAPGVGTVFNYNLLMLAQLRWAGQQPLVAGKHTIVFDFTAPASPRVAPAR